eukprot:sb/3478009/
MVGRSLFGAATPCLSAIAAIPVPDSPYSMVCRNSTQCFVRNLQPRAIPPPLFSKVWVGGSHLPRKFVVIDESPLQYPHSSKKSFSKLPNTHISNCTRFNLFSYI